MMRIQRTGRDSHNEPPVLLVKWYDMTKWLLGRVDSFPKNQRFIFGQRIAERTLNVLEVLVEPAYSHRKADLLAAFEGRAGASLQIFSTKDGSRIKSYPLKSEPAFDGMSAAGGKLYLVTNDGKLICFGPVIRK